MAIDVNSDDANRIRKMVPLATMPGTLFKELCSELIVKEIKDGVLFEKGDEENCLYYLLEGEVALQAEGMLIEVVSATQESSKFALAHQLPRKIDAVAKGYVRFIKLNAQWINRNLIPEFNEDKEMTMVEEDIDEDSGDWMTTLVKLPIFQRLPPANLQKVLIALEEVEIKKDQVIIDQGEKGDYCFFLKSGRCMVTRKPTPNSKEIRLAVLEKGEIFGEDALITGEPRTVSITALNNLTVLKLDKKHFISLVKEPLLTFIDYNQMLALEKEGVAVLDIRPPDEFEKLHVEAAINVPFYSLRVQFKNLNRDKPVVLVCDDGRASQAGAFFLLKNKFKAHVLRGGMQAIADKLQSEAGTHNFSEQDSLGFLSPEINEGLTSSSDVGQSQEIVKLISENKLLIEKIESLTQQYSKLEREKKQLEERFSALAKSFEQLKVIAQKLKQNAS